MKKPQKTRLESSILGTVADRDEKSVFRSKGTFVVYAEWKSTSLW